MPSVEPPRAPKREFAVASVRVVGAARTRWVERAAKRVCARGPKGVVDYVTQPAKAEAGTEEEQDRQDQCLQDQCLKEQSLTNQCLKGRSNPVPSGPACSHECNKRAAEEFDISDPLEELRELLELHDSGESVVWAHGTSAKKARLQLAEAASSSHQPNPGGRLESEWEVDGISACVLVKPGVESEWEVDGISSCVLVKPVVESEGEVDGISTCVLGKPVVESEWEVDGFSACVLVKPVVHQSVEPGIAISACDKGWGQGIGNTTSHLQDNQAACPAETRPWGVSCTVCHRFGACKSSSAYTGRESVAKRHKGLDFQEAEAEGACSIQGDTFNPNTPESNIGDFDSDIRNPSVPDGWQYVGTLYEQALFDQFLRTEHKLGLWEFIRKFGVAATNAAHDEFEHSCGHHLDNWWIKRQSVPETSKKREAERDAEQDWGPQVRRRRLTGKQKTPFGMYEEPQEEEPIQPEDADGHVLMVTGRIIWCSVCGRYQTSKRTCRLREQCPKQPENRSHYRLKRLQQGRHPATGEPLGEIAQRLTLAKWSAEVAISACEKGEEEESLTSGQPRGGEARASTDG